MLIFETFLGLGLLGLILMSLPALFGHGHMGHVGHGIDSGGHGLADAAHLGGLAHGHLDAGHAHAEGGLHLGHHGADHADAGHAAAAHAHAGHAGDESQTAASGVPAVATHHSDSGVPENAPRLWISPRSIFGFSLGYGATGMVLLHGFATPEPAAFGLAAIGGVAIQKLLFDPLWNGLMQFASHPSHGLEQMVMSEARAASSFDASGCGIVEIILDGQVSRVLARLTTEERQAGTQVHSGDVLRLESVDPSTGNCRVSKKPGLPHPS
ncbi:MAG TPA: hypothetical protein VGN26_12990 [Armatimonadota bacterium]|jgi:hypothetical protein